MIDTPNIVEYALNTPVVNIGQLTPQQTQQLQRAVKRGTLVKSIAGPYPKRKTVFHAPGFDAEGERQNELNRIRLIAALDDLVLGNRPDILRVPRLMS